ncbi:MULTISPECIES: GNAT family N-acetyltransferase [Stenotrophomonas]|uniref:GNAT family N-acetyltransferase n=1 Tax=Stenotrophomonas maltophilia TaxID=40324 RepID=A0A4S2CWS5_STEMA|nr:MULTISPECIES: GNAT family N-acetyltransferase [Stenotrophomonas]TGY33437.1 GNAT family N-acetyltransferase [Stenotrophomonas maltophilia]
MPPLRMPTASVADTDTLFRLMQLYYFDASRWSGENIQPDGLYDCTRSDVEATLREQPTWARLLWWEDTLCGFVLVDDVAFQGQPIRELADLFVLPTHRGKGIATAVVAALVTPQSGQWLLATWRRDLQAKAFWQRNLPRMGVEVTVPVQDDESDFDIRLIRRAGMTPD